MFSTHENLRNHRFHRQADSMHLKSLKHKRVQCYCLQCKVVTNMSSFGRLELSWRVQKEAEASAGYRNKGNWARQPAAALPDRSRASSRVTK